jgi:drug/metabolite transporter (DMT)-like permease
VAGALLLALEGDFSATWLGALLAFGAPLCWSLGSYASRKLDLPEGAMAPAAQWLAGGLLGALPTVVFEGTTPWAGSTAIAVVRTVTLSNGDRITYPVGTLTPGASQTLTF